ncbi:MAG TPA: GntR family transcriptional regulator [Planctomycetota bacterium]|nr:GntR family transcriptional regulator [Planctomycetota bacterium]
MKLIDRTAQEPPYLQAKKQLKELILSGKMTGRMPPERDLTKRFRLSYMTVRRAVTELVDEGLLYRELGKGTFVSRAGQVVKRTGNLGFIMGPDIRHGIANAYYGQVFAGFEAAAREEGYAVFFATRPDDVLPRPAVDAPRGTMRKVDGVVGVALDHKSQALPIAKLVPLVLIDDVIKGAPVPSVHVDNARGAHDAVAHLIGLGHRRIGHIAGLRGTPVMRERLAGYRAALDEAGIAWDEALVAAGDFEFVSGRDGLDRLLALRRPPTAIFCANDTMALGALQRAGELGVAVPRRLSLVGFDDLDVAAQVHPPLASVGTVKTEIGRAAFAAVRDLITGAAVADDHRIVLASRFIPRGSCAAPG